MTSSVIATRILQSSGRVIVTGQNEEELHRLEGARAIGLRIMLAEIGPDSSVLNLGGGPTLCDLVSTHGRTLLS